MSRTHIFRFMNGPVPYQFHPEAAVDLQVVWDFIAEEDNLDAADRTIEQIHAAIQGLVQFPLQGHRRRDLHETLLFQRVGNYLLAYASDRMPLLILAILHGRRNPHTLIAQLRTDD